MGYGAEAYSGGVGAEARKASRRSRLVRAYESCFNQTITAHLSDLLCPPNRGQHTGVELAKGPNQWMVDLVINDPIRDAQTQRRIHHMGERNDPPRNAQFRVLDVGFLVLGLCAPRVDARHQLNQKTDKQVCRDEGVEEKKHLEVVAPELGAG